VKSLDVTIRLPPGMRLSPERAAVGDDFEREEVLSWHTDESDGVEYFLALVVADIEAVREALESLDPIRWFDLAPVDDGRFYAYVAMDLRPADLAWRDALADRKIVVVPPIVFGPDGAVALTVLGSGRSSPTSPSRSKSKSSAWATTATSRGRWPGD
jgi:hypothetical protein